LLPVLVKLKLATAMMAGWSASSAAPIPTHAFAVMVAGYAAEPVEVKLWDENLRVAADVAIERDGSTDEATAKQLTELFHCRRTGRSKPLAQKTLMMLADLADKYRGKTIEFVSAYRTGSDEGYESPHRKAHALDFRIRGVPLREIRDYLWRTYTEVGIGWYPSEQFIHMDTRPGQQDTAWTFLKGDNHYHPWWAELARKPPELDTAQPKQTRKPGS
jgi:uncharacterized protein YcbK (DUF882 family)